VKVCREFLAASIRTMNQPRSQLVGVERTRQESGNPPWPRVLAHVFKLFDECLRDRASAFLFENPDTASIRIRQESGSAQTRRAAGGGRSKCPSAHAAQKNNYGFEPGHRFPSCNRLRKLSEYAEACKRNLFGLVRFEWEPTATKKTVSGCGWEDAEEEEIYERGCSTQQ